MHRELWGPGVTTAREASDYVHRLLADEIERQILGDAARSAAGAPLAILDFGCGVGGTLFHFADCFPSARLVGITVSERQVEFARRIAADRELTDRCSFALGDFERTELGVVADVVVAIESFAHAGRAAAFLENAARHLRPGGTLLVVDDFLALEPAALDARAARWVERFRAGWRVPAICTPHRFVTDAKPHGLELVEHVDLTPFVRPGGRARDWLVAAVGPVAERLGLAHMPFYGNMTGGNALQVGLREGFLRHELLILRKDSPGVSPGAPVA
jgi:SAM-dependent methyltransferase